MLGEAWRPGGSCHLLNPVSAILLSPSSCDPTLSYFSYCLQTSSLLGMVPLTRHSQHSPLGVNPETELGLPTALGSSLSRGSPREQSNQMSGALGTGRRLSKWTQQQKPHSRRWVSMSHRKGRFLCSISHLCSNSLWLTICC